MLKMTCKLNLTPSWGSWVVESMEKWQQNVYEARKVTYFEQNLSSTPYFTVLYRYMDNVKERL